LRFFRFCAEIADGQADRHARRVSGPRLAERAREREQHRSPCERDRHVYVAHDMTAGVHDERLRRLQRLYFLE
jgi:hypothetical protein